MRQNKNERNQQNHFAQYREEEGNPRFSQRDKRLLAGDLRAEDEGHGHIDAQGSQGVRAELRVRSKHFGKQLREKHARRPQRRRIDQTGTQ